MEVREERVEEGTWGGRGVASDHVQDTWRGRGGRSLGAGEVEFLLLERGRRPSRRVSRLLVCFWSRNFECFLS